MMIEEKEIAKQDQTIIKELYNKTVDDVTATVSINSAEKYQYIIQYNKTIIFNFELPVYSISFIEELLNYSQHNLKLFMSKTETEITKLFNNSSNKTSTDNHHHVAIHNFYKQDTNIGNPNIDNFIIQHKDDEFTYEIIIEFLIRLSDPTCSLTDDKLKDCIEYHCEVYPTNNSLPESYNEDLTYADDRSDVTRYFIPLYNDYYSINSLLSYIDIDKKAVHYNNCYDFTRQNLADLIKVEAYENLFYQDLTNGDDNNMLFKDYVTDHEIIDTFLSQYRDVKTIPLCIKDNEIIQILNNLTIEQVYNIKTLTQNCTNKKVILEVIRSISENDSENYITVTDEHLAIFKNLFLKIHKKHKNYHSLTETILIYYKTKNTVNEEWRIRKDDKFLFDYVISQGENIDVNDVVALEKSISYVLDMLDNDEEQLTLLFYYLTKNLQTEDIIETLKENYSSDSEMSFDQWISYVDNFNKNKDIPVAWRIPLLIE